MKNEFTNYREQYQQRQAMHLAAREAPRLALLERVLADWPPLLAEFPALQRVYLYGSLTKPGRFYSDSDIDVAYEGLPLEQERLLWDALEGWLDAEYILDLRPLPRGTFFGEQVVERGILLYERAD